MKAAIYIACHSGEGFDLELEAANAFCAQHGLIPGKVYHSDMVQDKGKVEAFLRAGRSGVFEVVVAGFPDCFSTRMIKQLVTAKIGLACYGAVKRRPTRAIEML